MSTLFKYRSRRTPRSKALADATLPQGDSTAFGTGWAHHFLAGALLISAGLSASEAAPTLKVLEKALEGVTISWSVRQGGYGTATISDCPPCRGRRTWMITPETRIRVDDAFWSLTRIPSHRAHSVTVFIDLETDRVNTVVLPDQPR